MIAAVPPVHRAAPCASLCARRRCRVRGSSSDRGVSSLELVLYTPLLTFMIFLVVQFSLAYLGNQVAQAAAREAARDARASGSTDVASRDAAAAHGLAYAVSVGNGLITNVQVDVVAVGDNQVRAVVTAQAVTIVPWLGGNISQRSQGPLEQFRPDQ